MEGKIFKRSTIFLVVFGCFVFGFFAEAQTSLLAIDYAPNLWFDFFFWGIIYIRGVF